jgi:ATP-dependent Lon protease
MLSWAVLTRTTANVKQKLDKKANTFYLKENLPANVKQKLDKKANTFAASENVRTKISARKFSEQSQWKISDGK